MNIRRGDLSRNPSAFSRPSRLKPTPLFLALSLAFSSTALAAVQAPPGLAPAKTSLPANEAAGLAPALSPANREGGGKEVAFVDTSVTDYQTLMAGIRPGVEVVPLDGKRDGLARMAEWAKGHAGYDAIHVLSHGTAGTLYLGAATLDGAAIDGHRADLAAIGRALTADGDLLLYGCNVAQGADGVAFVRELARATGADVAASEDATGSAARGGDWELEYVAGRQQARPDPTITGSGVDTPVAITAAARNRFAAVLAPTTFTLTTPGTDTTTGVATETFTENAHELTFTMDQYADVSGVILGYYYGLAPGYTILDGTSHGGADTLKITVSMVGYTFDLQSVTLYDSTTDQTTRAGYTLTTNKGGTKTGSISTDSSGIWAATENSFGSADEFLQISSFSIVFSEDFTGHDAAPWFSLANLIVDNITAAPPTVSSIARTTPATATTNATSVVYTVTFSESVTGVDSGDFSVTTTGGVTGASVTNVTGSGTTWSVTVGTGTGDGTIRLDVVDDDTIVNGATTALGGAGAGNGDYSSGETYTIDKSAPTTTIATATFSADTGGSSTDFITNTAAQTISGTLSTSIAAGETVQVSLDDGSNWSTAATLGGSDLWWITGQTLTASNTLKVKVTDAVGNDGTTFSQAYVLDTTAPTTTIATAAFSADTAANGGTNGDFITKTAAQTVSGTLSANLATGETVYVSLDGGSNWSAATASVGSNTWSLSGQTLTANDTLKVKISDTAGNDGTTFSQAYVLDTTAPTTAIATATFSADTGSSSTDFITKTAAQTIGGTLSANLAAGETVYVSLDGGSNWSAATASVGSNTWSLSGQTLGGSNTLKVKVSDSAGNDGTAFSQAYVLDTTAPTFDAAPAGSSVTTSGFTPTASTDEAGTVYYLVIADNAAAPTSAQVVAGGDYGAVTVLAAGSQAVSSSPYTPTFTAVSGLTSTTAYDLYMVATDTVGNAIASPTKVDVTTATPNAAPVANTVAVTGTPLAGQQLTGGYAYSDTDSDAESGSVYQWYRSTQGTANAAAMTAITGASGNAAATSTYAYSAVTDDVGKYLYYCVTPKDNAGTTGSESCNGTGAGPIGVPVPVVDSPADNAAVNTPTPSFSGTGYANAVVTVKVDGTTACATTVTGTAWSCTASSALTETTHTLAVTQNLNSVDSQAASSGFTVDHSPPVNSDVGASATGRTTANLTATSNEAATGYWVALAGAGQTAPTAAQVKAGQNSAGTTDGVVASGNGAMVANTAKTFGITGLSAGSPYTLCLMVEDATTNQSTVTCNDVATQAIPSGGAGSADIILPTGGGSTTFSGTGLTVIVTNNGQEGSGISMGNGSSANVTLPDGGTVDIQSQGGSQLTIGTTEVNGQSTHVLTVAGGSATVTATQAGQPTVSAGGITVVSGQAGNRSTAAVDPQGGINIEVAAGDSVIINPGVTSTNAQVDIGQGGTVQFQTGGQSIDIAPASGGATLAFNSVDLNGVSTPVPTVVSGEVQVTVPASCAPMLSVNTTPISAGTGNSQAQAGEGNGLITVTLTAGQGLVGLCAGGGRAAETPTPVYVGESAEFTPDGALQRIRLGSMRRDQGWAGDPLNLTGFGAGVLEASVTRIDGTTNRLQKSLAAAFLSTVNNAGDVWTYQSQGQNADTGVWTLNAQTPAGASARLAVWPVGEIVVDEGVDMITISGNGMAQIRAGNLLSTFAPALVDPQGFAAEVAESGADELIFQPDGTLHAVFGNHVYVVQPDWEIFPGGARGFAADDQGRITWTDADGNLQLLDPAFGDLGQLIATAQQEDPSFAFQSAWRGEVNVVYRGVPMLLVPDNLMTPTPEAHRQDAWWTEGDKAYLRYPDLQYNGRSDFCQGFTVRLPE